MKITSPAFQTGEEMPAKFTCDGENISPPLNFEEVPEGTRSLVLIMDDPDVPEHIRSDRMWDHWVVFNIPPETTGVAEGEEPPGVPGAGTAGNYKYHGACPPDGEHRYRFKLYALSDTLDLPKGSTKSQVEEAMQGIIIEQVQLVGLYDRFQ